MGTSGRTITTAVIKGKEGGTSRLVGYVVVCLVIAVAVSLLVSDLLQILEGLEGLEPATRLRAAVTVALTASGAGTILLWLWGSTSATGGGVAFRDRLDLFAVVVLWALAVVATTLYTTIVEKR